MNALENLLIIAGISLDIFAAMECQGSLVAKIDKKQLVKLCALIAAWQMAALFVGSYLSGLLSLQQPSFSAWECGWLQKP